MDFSIVLISDISVANTDCIPMQLLLYSVKCRYHNSVDSYCNLCIVVHSSEKTAVML